MNWGLNELKLVIFKLLKGRKKNAASCTGTERLESVLSRTFIFRLVRKMQAKNTKMKS